MGRGEIHICIETGFFLLLVVVFCFALFLFFEQRHPVGTGPEGKERAGGWFQQQVSASAHHSRREGGTMEMLVPG